MTRSVAAAVLAVATSVTVAAGQERPAPQRTLHIRVGAVDEQGKPVMDLRPDEFEVAINLFHVPIESVRVVRPESAPPRLVVLLFDDLATPSSIAPRSREAARRIVARLGQDDQMTIAGLSNAEFTKPTGDRARLLKAIDAYNGYGMGVLPYDRLGEHVLETVTSVSRQISEVGMRKLIIGIGAGWLFDTPIPPPSIGRDLRREWTAAVRAMAVSDVNLYAIDPVGVGRSPVTGGETGFARESGGHAFTNTNDMKGAVDRIFEEATHYYVLSVGDPPTGRKDEIRELDVRIKRPGVTVRARRWLSGGASSPAAGPALTGGRR